MMKRNVFSYALLFLIGSCFFAACGGDDADNDKDSSGKSDDSSLTIELKNLEGAWTYVMDGTKAGIMIVDNAGNAVVSGPGTSGSLSEYDYCKMSFSGASLTVQLSSGYKMTGLVNSVTKTTCVIHIFSQDGGGGDDMVLTRTSSTGVIYKDLSKLTTSEIKAFLTSCTWEAYSVTYAKKRTITFKTDGTFSSTSSEESFIGFYSISGTTITLSNVVDAKDSDVVTCVISHIGLYGKYFDFNILGGDKEYIICKPQ